MMDLNKACTMTLFSVKTSQIFVINAIYYRYKVVLVAIQQSA